MNNAQAVLLSNFGLVFPVTFTQTAEPFTSFETIRLKQTAFDAPENKTLENSSLTQVEISWGLKARQQKAFRPSFETGFSQETFFSATGVSTFKAQSLPTAFIKINLEQDLFKKNGHLIFIDGTGGVFGISKAKSFEVHPGYMLDLAANYRKHVSNIDFGTRIHFGYSSQDSSIAAQTKIELGIAFTAQYFWPGGSK